MTNINVTNKEKIKAFLERTRKIRRCIGYASIVGITGVITHRFYPEIAADLLKIIKGPIKDGIKGAMGMGPINPSLGHGIKGIRGAKGPINPYLVNPSLDGIKAMGPIKDGVEGGRTIGFPGGF